MSLSLIGIVTVIYLAVSISEFADHSPMGIVWFGYALANVGLMASMVLR